MNEEAQTSYLEVYNLHVYGSKMKGFQA